MEPLRFDGASAGGNRHDAGFRHGCNHDGRFISVSDPGPNGVCVVTQAPLSTSFHALPW
jgi:hypothetical protein